MRRLKEFTQKHIIREVYQWFDTCYSESHVSFGRKQYFAGHRTISIKVFRIDEAITAHRFHPSYFKHGEILDWCDVLATAGLNDWECKDPGCVLAPFWTTREPEYLQLLNWKGGNNA